MTMKEAINKDIKGQNLTLEEAKEVMGLMLGGEATQAQLGSHWQTISCSPDA